MSERVINNVVVDGINYISKEQFHKMCKISKQTAKLLLDYNIVPSIKTYKQTRCYKIAWTDAVDFLNNKESRMRKIPAGVRRSNKKRKNTSRACLNHDFSDQDIILIKAFLAERFTQYPDMLKCKQISEETGLSTSTIVEMAKKEYFTSITVKGVYLISKQSFIDYASSKEFYSLRSYSKSFINLWEEILHILHKSNTVESAVKHNENKNERRLLNE